MLMIWWWLFAVCKEAWPGSEPGELHGPLHEREGLPLQVHHHHHWSSSSSWWSKYQSSILREGNKNLGHLDELNNNQLWPPVAPHIHYCPHDCRTKHGLRVMMLPVLSDWTFHCLFLFHHLPLLSYPGSFLPLPRAPHTPTNPNWACQEFPPWWYDMQQQQ